MCPTLGACKTHSFVIAGNARRVSEVDSNCAIRKNIAEAILVAVVNSLDHIGGEASVVTDFLNPAAMYIGQTSLQLLGDQVEKL